jgi:hypothetical protein
VRIRPSVTEAVGLRHWLWVGRSFWRSMFWSGLPRARQTLNLHITRFFVPVQVGMSPPRRSVSGLNFRTWMRANATRAVGHYRRRTSPSSGRHTSPKTAASLARLRNRARRAVTAVQNYNAAILLRNTARVKKMLKEIANYNARHRHKLVRQPNGSYSLARRS